MSSINIKDLEKVATVSNGTKLLSYDGVKGEVATTTPAEIASQITTQLSGSYALKSETTEVENLVSGTTLAKWQYQYHFADIDDQTLPDVRRLMIILEDNFTIGGEANLVFNESPTDGDEVRVCYVGQLGTNYNLKFGIGSNTTARIVRRRFNDTIAADQTVTIDFVRGDCVNYRYFQTLNAWGRV